MLKATPSMRKKKIAKGVEILDDETSLRYKKIHGTNGLCHNLVEIFNAMVELRMMVEYGDYLAYTCTALNRDNMSDMKWKVEELDWQAVAEEVQKEQATLADEKRYRLPISPTPYLDDIAKAAERLGYEADLIRYQIVAYANRNNFCHGGLKAMINHGDFQELAERMMEDKRTLKVIFHGRPSEQIEMRKVIKIVEREWFDSVWIDEAKKERPVKYYPSSKGLAKLRSIAASRPDSP